MARGECRVSSLSRAADSRPTRFTYIPGRINNSCEASVELRERFRGYRDLAFSVQCALFNASRLSSLHATIAEHKYVCVERGTKERTPAEVHDAAHEISSYSLGFSLLCCSSYTYLLLAGLSYGARKHTQIRAQLPHWQWEVIPSVYFMSAVPRRPGPRISSEIASTSITNSHLARPDVVPPSGGFSARCPPSCYFGSPESDFHFGGFLRISMGTSRTRRKFAHCGPRKSRRRVSRAERSEMHQCDLLCW